MTGDLWLTNASLCDVTSTAAPEPVSILVSDGIVQRICPSGGPGAPPVDARKIDLGTRYVIPGLFDAHAHVTSIDAAHRALRTGVTTVRSAGVEGFQDVGLRIVSRRRPDLVPDVSPAGLVAAPSIADGRDLLLTDPTLAVLMGARSLRLGEIAEPVVALNASKGARAIKTHATERAGLTTRDPHRLVCEPDELAHVVEVARRFGLPVMCHAHGSEGCHMAAEAGVASIEHGTFAENRTLELMAQRGIWLVPTLSVLHDMASGGGEYTDPALRERGKRMFDAARDTVQRAVRIGVNVAAGTDTRYSANSRSSVAGEIRLLIEAGMTTADALFAATGAAGTLLGDARVSGIEVGHAAGLVVLDGDPRSDVTVLANPQMVIHRGSVIEGICESGSAAD